MPALRLLIVHETPVMGGAERYLLDLAAAALRDGLAVTVCLCEPYTPNELTRSLMGIGARTERLDLNLSTPSTTRIVPAFWRLVAKESPTAIVFNKRINWFDFRHMILAAWLSRKSRLVAVEHWHPEGWPVYPKRGFGPNLRLRHCLVKAKCRFYANCLDAVICMNRAAREKFVVEYGYPARRTHVVYNGIDTSRFAFDARKRSSWRDRLGIGGAQTLLVAAGRMSPEKGMDVLLDAMSHLVRFERRDVILVLAGDGPQREQLEKQAAGLGIANRVRFTGVQSDIPGILSAADVFVNPSRRESFGLSVAEAMATERCVVATRVGGVPELVNGEETGLLVSPERPIDLAAAIGKVAGDAPLRSAVGKAARARICAEFDLRQSMQRTLDIALGRNAA